MLLAQMSLIDIKDQCLAGALVGTHAHEVASIAAQLLAQYDDKAGGSPDAPVPISAIVAHLLFLTSNGGLGAAVALADTFGTEAFLAIALAADVPREFLEDVRQRYPDEPQPKPGEHCRIALIVQAPCGTFLIHPKHPLSQPPPPPPPLPRPPRPCAPLPFPPGSDGESIHPSLWRQGRHGTCHPWSSCLWMQQEWFNSLPLSMEGVILTWHWCPC